LRTIYADDFFGFEGDNLWMLGCEVRYLIAVNGPLVHLQ
jgi:hypothetical protein